jgi:hypothetical protein
MPMKPFIILCLFFLFAVGCGSDATVKPLRVLFIGNSYTFWHNLPEIVAQMAHSQGKRLYYETSVQGGWDFQDHWEAGDALQLITENRWDVIVLQNHSFGGVGGVEAMMDYGQRFGEAIAATEAEVLLYVTWAYAEPLEWVQKSPEALALYTDMQAHVVKSYTALAEAIGGTLCPVGPAWEAFRAANPEIPLHHTDHTHPSPLGAYLSGLMFTTLLFGETPRDMPGTLYPYFTESERSTWGEVLVVEEEVRRKMEAVVAAVHDRFKQD